LFPFIKPIEPTFAYISASSGTCVNTFSGDEAYFEGISNNEEDNSGTTDNVPTQDSSTSNNEDQEDLLKPNTSNVSPATGNDFNYTYLAISILIVALISFVLLKMRKTIFNIKRRNYGTKKQ
jgi:hypothetical protein